MDVDAAAVYVEPETARILDELKGAKPFDRSTCARHGA